MNPTTSVPIAPAAKPAFLNAAGIARIPDPRDDFRRCTNDPIVLKMYKWYKDFAFIISYRQDLCREPLN